MNASRSLLFLTIISLAATFYIYPQLPDQIPVHWGIDGNIDRYGSKVNALITGALPLILFFLMKLVPKIDPRKDSYKKHMGAYIIIVNVIILFIGGIHWLTIGYSMGYNINIVFFVKAGMGILFMAIGNYLPVIQPNYTLGIRVPWTLASEEVWIKTHKAGGYSFVITGFIWFCFSFINKPWVFYFLLGLLFMIISGVTLYSYYLFTKMEKNS